MTPVRAALLFVFMFSGIALWGVAIYTGDAAAGGKSLDGYGVVAAVR